MIRLTAPRTGMVVELAKRRPVVVSFDSAIVASIDAAHRHIFVVPFADGAVRDTLRSVHEALPAKVRSLGWVEDALVEARDMLGSAASVGVEVSQGVIEVRLSVETSYGMSIRAWRNIEDGIVGVEVMNFARQIGSAIRRGGVLTVKGVLCSGGLHSLVTSVEDALDDETSVALDLSELTR